MAEHTKSTAGHEPEAPGLHEANARLRTVNRELQVAVNEQIRLANDLQNLILSTDFGTVFLDLSGRLKFYTPSARRLLDVPLETLAWPLDAIQDRLVGVDLRAEVARIARQPTRAEFEVVMGDGRCYRLGVGPYVTVQGNVEGVVLTFVDVTDRHLARQQAVRALERNQQLLAELREALQNVKTLSGLLPICAHCKRIRNEDSGSWQRVEEYISSRTDALFSHGLCPECLKQHYPEHSG